MMLPAIETAPSANERRRKQATCIVETQRKADKVMEKVDTLLPLLHQNQLPLELRLAEPCSKVGRRCLLQPCRRRHVLGTLVVPGKMSLHSEQWPTKSTAFLVAFGISNCWVLNCTDAFQRRDKMAVLYLVAKKTWSEWSWTWRAAATGDLVRASPATVPALLPCQPCYRARTGCAHNLQGQESSSLC